jgi:sec-independent protein translocase protein TatA
MPALGVPELLIILLIIVALFGAGKLANLGGALGKGVRDFRTNVKVNEEEAPNGTAEPRSNETPDNDRDVS